MRPRQPLHFECLPDKQLQTKPIKQLIWVFESWCFLRFETVAQAPILREKQGKPAKFAGFEVVPNVKRAAEVRFDISARVLSLWQ